MPSATYTKKPEAVRDYTIDWTDYLNGDTISSSSWSVPSGLTLDSSSNTTTTTTAWLADGTLGERYTVTNTITTAAGRTDSRDLLIFIAPRPGLMRLLERLRLMTETTESDYTLDGVTYWSDHHLQAILDGYRTMHRRLKLVVQPDLINGSYSYTEYFIPGALDNFEEKGPDSGWRVYDTTGAEVSNYTVNYDAGVIVFDSSTAGQIYYLDCRTVDLNRAAGDVWAAKTAHVAQNMDWATDNHDLKAAQVYHHYLRMALMYRSRAGFGLSKLVRRDEVL